MANDDSSETPSRADSKNPFFFFPRFLALDHLQGLGVRLGKSLGVLSIEPFLGEAGVRPEGSIVPPPPTGSENPACDLAHTDISVHLLHGCTPFFLHHLFAAWHLLRHPLVPHILATTPSRPSLLHGTFVVASRQLVGLTWNVLAIPLPPKAGVTTQQLVFNLTGSAKVPTLNPKCAPLLAAQRAEVAAAHHEVLTRQFPPLRCALSKAPSIWVPSQAPVPAPVHVPDNSATLSLPDSVVLGWLLRPCGRPSSHKTVPRKIDLPPDSTCRHDL